MLISVSAEAEAKALQIPNFTARLERFINDKFDLEQWRKRRAKADVSAIVEEGQREGVKYSTLGTDRAELFARLKSLADGLPDGQ